MTAQGYMSDEWLLSYAAGSLSEAHSVLVATHVDFHPEMQQTVRDAEAIGGALMEDSAPAPLAATALGDVLSRIDALSVDEEEAPQPLRCGDPISLTEYLGKNLDDLRWRTMGPGMKHVKLWSGPKGEKLWLLKAKGGTQVPLHDHTGAEMTLVLRGGFKAKGVHYTPGMLEFADEDITDHFPQIDDGEDCICLVVTEAPIRLHSFVGKIFQRIIGL
ncbi:MAG: cupin domain-containing protein [Kordiimonadaceae bacterium]|nr:cupin domain-containing protein [Kordiimonadaceae bacterium]